MTILQFDVTAKDLQDSDKYCEVIADYPAYCSTSNLTSGEICVLGKFLEKEILQNNLPEKTKLVVRFDIVPEDWQG